MGHGAWGVGGIYYLKDLKEERKFISHKDSKWTVNAEQTLGYHTYYAG